MEVFIIIVVLGVFGIFLTIGIINAERQQKLAKSSNLQQHVSQTSEEIYKPELKNEKAGRTKINPPAIGLICVGAILALISLWYLSFLVLIKDKRNANDMGDEMLALSFMLFIVIIVMAGLVIYGASQMIRLKSLAWSKTAAILSICTIISGLPGILLGVPVGIWALIVLNKPEVKFAFKDNSQ